VKDPLFSNLRLQSILGDVSRTSDSGYWQTDSHSRSLPAQADGLGRDSVAPSALGLAGTFAALSARIAIPPGVRPSHAITLFLLAIRSRFGGFIAFSARAIASAETLASARNCKSAYN